MKLRIRDTVPVAIVRIERDTQPADVNALYKRLEPAMLAVVTDVDQHNAGPTGWPCAAGLLRWARAIEIRVGGEPDNHEASMAAAGRFGRVLLIVTDEAHAATWRLGASSAGCKRFLPIAPEDMRPRRRGVR